MKMNRLMFTACSAIGALVCWSNPILAHSFPEKENPSAGQKLSSTPSEVSIKYDAPIEHLFANLQVLDAAGNNMATAQPQVSSDGYTLSVKVGALKPGDYTVKWSVVGIDTHHTQGSYAFSVSGTGS
jgi:copper resistance protein C